MTTPICTHIEGEENPSVEVLKGLTIALKVKSSEILPF